MFFDHTIAVVQPVRGATANVNEHKVSTREHYEAHPKKVKKVERIFKKVENSLDNCSAYRRSFWVTWNGKIQLCSFAEYPSVTVLDMSFQSAWQNLLEKLNKIESPDKCRECKYEGFCKRCPGVLYAECGSCEQVTDAFCEEAKLLYEIYHAEEI